MLYVCFLGFGGGLSTSSSSSSSGPCSFHKILTSFSLPLFSESEPETPVLQLPLSLSLYLTHLFSLELPESPIPSQSSSHSPSSPFCYRGLSIDVNDVVGIRLNNRKPLILLFSGFGAASTCTRVKKIWKFPNRTDFCAKRLVTTYTN